MGGKICSDICFQKIIITLEWRKDNIGVRVLEDISGQGLKLCSMEKEWGCKGYFHVQICPQMYQLINLWVILSLVFLFSTNSQNPRFCLSETCLRGKVFSKPKKKSRIIFIKKNFVRLILYYLDSLLLFWHRNHLSCHLNRSDSWVEGILVNTAQVKEWLIHLYLTS